MDINALLPVLQACLSHDQNHVKEAEKVLKQHESLPGQAVQLLRVAAEETVDAGVRHMAAINFKNFVKRSWEAPQHEQSAQQAQQVVIPDADKVVVRQNLLEALIRAPHAIQSQLSEVFKAVAYADFPEQWPSLVEEVYKNLGAQDQTRVHGALLALRTLARKYEFRDEEERAPLEGLISATFPLLLSIFQQLLVAPLTPQICTYLKLVCKTFWSATYMGVPNLLMDRTAFLGWMGCLHTALGQPQPEDVAALDPEDRPQTPYWKSRKWVLHITYRLFNRYGVVKVCRDKDKAVAEMYTTEVMSPFLTAHLGLMAQLAQGTYFSPRTTNLLFQYMGHAVGIPSCYKAVGGHWDQMLHNVAFPLMCFTDQDARLWAEDPQEYIRKGYDILEDMYSPKTAAANFAHEMCTKKKLHLDSFMAMLAGLLVPFSQQQQAAAAGSGPQPSAADARRVDGALLAVGCLAPLLKQKKPYKQQLGSMMAAYVMPCFASPHGHLRSKAAWLAGVFCDTPFPDGTCSGPTYMAFFERVVSCLADPELPVRVDAVVSLRHFLEDMEDVGPVAPMLPQLLNAIFALMDQVDNEDLVFSLEALVEKFGEAVGPYAVQMAQQLTAAFWKYCGAESGDDDDDDAAGIATFGCMRALNTLLESCSGQPQLVAAMEEVLYPLMQRMLSSEGQDIFEEVLEMLSYLTYYAPAISDRLWALWPQLEAAVKEWALDYWENLLVPLDNFISRGTDRFLASAQPDYQASVYAMVQVTLASDAGERDVVPAVKLLEVVLQNCRGRVDRWVAPYLELVLAKLATATNRTLKDTLLLVLANALYYNAPLTLGVLAQSGGPAAIGTLFGAWFTAIFASKKSGKPMHFRRMHDKKVCVLGLCALLACPDEALPDAVKAGLPQVLSGIVRLLVALKEQQDEQDKLAELGSDGDEAEEDDDDDDDAGDVDLDDDEAFEALRNNPKLKKLFGEDGEGDGDDSDVSDDEFTDDEEVHTPIDPVDPYMLLADTLSGLQAHLPSRHAQLMSACDASAQAALAGMVAFAQEMRAKGQGQGHASASGQASG